MTLKQQIEARKRNIGSVSSGTMKTDDLIPSFLWELQHQKPLRREHGKLAREIEARMEQPDYYESGDADSDLDELFDALETYAPEGFYFGSHPGDGADYGFWLSESFAEDFDGLKVDDLAEVPKGYRGAVLEVNDHGNMTLYWVSRNKFTEQWGIV